MSDAYSDSGIAPKNVGYVHTAATHAFEGLSANPDVNHDPKYVAKLAYIIGIEYTKHAVIVEEDLRKTNKDLVKKVGLIHSSALIHLRSHCNSYMFPEFGTGSYSQNVASEIVDKTYQAAIQFVTEGEAFHRAVVK